jgi:outer membrane protein TolC
VSKLAYKEPELELPETFKYTATADTASVANLEWKQFFSDPMLQNLIEKGIKNNYDLQIALKQVASSQEKLKQAKYLQYPDVGFGVSAQISKPSKNSMNGQSLNLFLGKSYVEDYNAAFNFLGKLIFGEKSKISRKFQKCSICRLMKQQKPFRRRLLQPLHKDIIIY